MPFAVNAVAPTQEAAERQVLDDAPALRVLRCRRIDFAGLPPLSSGPRPEHWVVLVEHSDPVEDAKRSVHADPETACEREVRQLYLKMALDPQMLVTGVIETFACPACEVEITFELPAPRETRYPIHRQCGSCRALLERERSGPWRLRGPAAKRSPDCVFCGAKANSKEHLIPAWISKRLGIKDFLSERDAFIAGGIPRLTQPISFASYRAQVFCDGCNTHFKSLEDAVIPLLVPMAKGMAMGLDRASQQLLSLWATKTAIALLTGTDGLGDIVPARHRRVIRDEARVPGEVFVGFFGWSGGPIVATGSPSLRSETTECDGYAAILTFAQVGFYVMGLRGSLPHRGMIAGDSLPVRQFWPATNQLIGWPPLVRLDNTRLPDLLSLAPLRRAGDAPAGVAEILGRRSLTSA
jgi:hypothetical protein